MNLRLILPHFYIELRFNVVVHFVRPLIDPENAEGIDPDDPIFIPAITPANGNDANTLLDDISRKVNAIWVPQVNVKFNFALANPVGPDKSPLNTIEYSSRTTPGVYYPDLSATNVEVNNIINATVSGFTDDENSNPFDGSIHLYFVTNFVNYPDGTRLDRPWGFTWIGRHYVFISDSPGTDSNQLARIIAHELGHSLGLEHTDELAPSSDGYKADITTLMWRDWVFVGGNHIGYAHWKQLNDANPEIE